jgi:hypothetical protein
VKSKQRQQTKDPRARDRIVAEPDAGMEGARATLLLKYACREPRRFIQHDAFFPPDDSDDLVRPDEDGDCILSGRTTELMGSPFSVRVLVEPQADPGMVARMLRKIAGYIERDDLPLAHFGLDVEKFRLDELSSWAGQIEQQTKD